MTLFQTIIFIIFSFLFTRIVHLCFFCTVEEYLKVFIKRRNLAFIDGTFHFYKGYSKDVILSLTFTKDEDGKEISNLIIYRDFLDQLRNRFKNKTEEELTKEVLLFYNKNRKKLIK